MRRAAKSAERVFLAVLFKVELASETLHFALQNTGLTDTNGQYWQPANAGIISYDDFPVASLSKATPSAQKRTYRITLPDLAFGNRMVSDEAEYRGRKITQFLQIKDASGNPLSTPKFLHVGFMDVVRSSVQNGSAVLTCECEGLFSYKARSNFGVLTDTDQRARYPDDAGLDWAKKLQEGVVLPWPPI